MTGLSRFRIRQIVRKEVRQLLRDPRARPILFVAPVVQLFLFGYAVNTDVQNTPLAVLDLDRSAASRQLVDEIVASGYFKIVFRAERPGELVESLDRGQALIALEIPPLFSRDLASGRGAVVQVLVDGTDSNTGTIASGNLRRAILAYGLQKSGLGENLAKGPRLEPRAWFNPSLESRAYNVPGVIGILILLMCLLLTSFSVVRERELGTLDQLRVSPVKPAELILGKTIPVAGVALIDLALITAVGTAWFGIPLRGSLLVLLAASLLFILSGLTAGLLISTVSKTQQEAFLTMYLVLLPSIILSGFFFPIYSMPELFQWISFLNPLRYFLEIVRGVFLKGASPIVLWPQFAALLVLGTVGIAVAIRRFERSID
ncbi:MAG: ABC transporter permease [Gemmatimonadales bacterium]